MSETNPWSRLIQSEHNSLHGIKDSVRRYLRGLRGLPRGPINRQSQGGNSIATRSPYSKPNYGLVFNSH